MSEIQQEILDVLGAKPQGKKENRTAFRKRLLKGVSDLSDPDFDKLSSAAQSWANEASEANDHDQPLPDFPDAEPETEAEDEVDEAVEEAVDEPETPAQEAIVKPKKASKTALKVAPAKKAAAPQKRAAKPAAKPGKRGDGVVDAILAHVLKNPDDGAPEIVAALKADGVTASPSTASTVRSAFKMVARFLSKKKLLTKELFS